MKTILQSIFLTLAITTATASASSPEPTLPAPLQQTLDQYAKIQSALATDSMKGVSESATTIIKIVSEDTSNLLPKSLSSQSKILSQATDIKAARSAFKPLSTTLISALASQPKKTGHYFEANCPMADASWIQTDKIIKNPYYGASMLSCGSIKESF